MTRNFLIALRDGSSRRAHARTWYACREQARAVFGGNLEDVTEVPDSMLDVLMARELAFEAEGEE